MVVLRAQVWILAAQPADLQGHTWRQPAGLLRMQGPKRSKTGSKQQAVLVEGGQCRRMKLAPGSRVLVCKLLRAPQQGYHAAAHMLTSSKALALAVHVTMEHLLPFTPTQVHVTSCQRSTAFATGSLGNSPQSGGAAARSLSS